MSAITVGGDLIHYEVLGRGRAVILVHGWLGSWRYWMPTMQHISTKYRVYALDLFGFGDSAKNPAKYTISEQVKLIDEFMKQLGVPKAAMIGHGLGAMVLAEYALHNQDKVARLLLAGAPLYDPGDLQERTPAGQRKLLTADPNALNKLTSQSQQPAATTPVTSVPAETTTPMRSQPAVSPAAPSASAAPSQPDSAPHTMPTVPRVGPEARARMEEAARAAGTAIAANKPPSNDGAATSPTPANSPASPPITPAAGGAQTVASQPMPVPSEPKPAAPANSPASPTATTQPVAGGTQTIASQPVSIPSEPKPSTPSPFEHLAQMTFSNKNPLLEAFASVSMESLLAKCFRPGEPSYEKLKVDIDKCDRAVLKQSVLQFDSGRMLDTLRLLTMPVVVVHGVDDPVIPRPNDDVWHYLTVEKEEMLLPFPLPGVRHFPMLEHEPFQRMVLQFLDLPEVHKLEVGHKWVRRTR